MKAMKNMIVYPLIAILLCLFSALNCVKNEKMITVENNKIISSFSAHQDASIDMNAFEKHYGEFPERWETAFEYLVNNDLKALPLGRKDLNENVYIAVSEYTTKDIENADYEAHKKYIDLQYIITGEELMGLTREHAKLKIIAPYVAEKDIEFYDYNGGELLRATPDNYFIFFPNDVHKPCIKKTNNSKVKKIVIKIKYN
jgi:YhcH/YjgK/YiaL family protein